ncbi:MAG TPA: hypothetical protein VGC34_12210, partial [Steroidobacteraceae bacterium]
MHCSVRHSVKRILRPWVLVSVACALGGAPAWAAEDAAATGPQVPADVGLEEVVVTAQFRQQKVQDTPIAITAVNAAML